MSDGKRGRDQNEGKRWKKGKISRRKEGKKEESREGMGEEEKVRVARRGKGEKGEGKG